MTTCSEAPRAFNPKIPFSRSEARAAGLSEDVLRTSAYHRVFYDCYVCSTITVTPALRARAAVGKVGGGAYASHHTAARLWGIPVPVDGLIHVTARKSDGRTRCRGILTHQPLTTSDRIGVRDSVRVSSPSQVFCELAAAGLGLVDLVVAGDAMLKKKQATLESLSTIVESMTGRGARLAGRALGYLRLGVDSPMESRLRMLLVLAGLPEPTVNVILREVNGEWGRRLDMCLEALKLIIEYDGEQHGGLDHRDADIHRREELERLGYRVISVTAHGIYRDPLTTLCRVRDAIRERGGHAPFRFQPEWRRHFPTRPGTLRQD